MAPEIALDCIPEADLGAPLRILDPMCGSGTVLSVAAQRGHHATGVDLDPLAILMTKVATSPLDAKRCELVRERIVAEASADRKTRLPWKDKETRSFAKYWFADRQRLQLSRLSRAISELPKGPQRNIAQIALSRIIITKTPKASLAADTSHSRPHRVTTASSFDVISGYSYAFTGLVELLKKRSISGTARARLDDCRTLKSIASASFDLALTSPPYLNAIDYMRGHKMALIWLGYTIPELRSIRSECIGAERSLDGPAEHQTAELVATIEREAADPSTLPVAVLKRYAQDLLHFSRQMKRVLKPEARLAVVIGNSTLRGNFIQNEMLVQQALEHNGFMVEQRFERTLPESRRYLPISGSRSESQITRRIRTETVLHLVRAR